MKKLKFLDLIEINDEEKLRAEIYYYEQQQMLQQPSPFYSNGVNSATVGVTANNCTIPQLMMNAATNPNQIGLNTVNVNQFNEMNNQFIGHHHHQNHHNQSPRLKPINQFINGNATALNRANLKNIKSPYAKK